MKTSHEHPITQHPMYQGTDLKKPILVMPLDGLAKLMEKIPGTTAQGPGPKGRIDKITLGPGAFAQTVVLNLKGKKNQKDFTRNTENSEALFTAALEALADPLVKQTLSLKGIDYVPYSIQKSSGKHVDLTFKQEATIANITKGVYDGFVTVVMLVNSKKDGTSKLTVQKIIAPIRKGRVYGEINDGVDRAHAVQKAKERTKAALIATAEKALEQAKEEAAKMLDSTEASVFVSRAELILKKAQRFNEQRVKILICGDGYSTHQLEGKTTERYGRLWVVVTQARFMSADVQMEVFVACDSGEVVRTDLTQHFANAKAKTFTNEPDPAKPLADQEVVDEIPGVEQGAKDLECSHLKMTYAKTDGGSFVELAPNADGNFENDSSQVEFRASHPGQGIISQDAMLMEVTGGSFDGTFTTVKSWDTGTKDNAYFTDNGVAWMLWLAKNETGWPPFPSPGGDGKKHLTIVLGVGTGGKRLRRDGLVLGNTVWEHENGGHKWIWNRVPGHQFPADAHEGLADVGALLREYYKLWKLGKLTSAYVFADPRMLGHYTAGGYRDADGQEEIRNGRVVHKQTDSQEPHARGRALCGSVMDSFEDYLRYLVQTLGDSPETIAKWIIDCIKCYDSILTTSKSRKTTFEDVLASHLDYDKTSLGGKCQQAIKDAYAKRAIYVITPSPAQIKKIYGTSEFHMLFLTTPKQVRALAAARRAEMLAERQARKSA